MSRRKHIPRRDQVKPEDQWDLSGLYSNDAAWEEEFGRWQRRTRRYKKFHRHVADDAKTMASCLKFHLDFERVGERLGSYAYLRSAQDTANDTYQRMLGLFRNAASRAGEAASFLQPELVAVSDRRMKRLLADRRMAPYRLLIERWRRYKPHTLSDREEQLLAMQSEVAHSAAQIFRQLQNADLKFGTIKDEKGRSVELTNSTFATLLHSPRREVRKNAFHQHYAQYAAHKHTLAATLAGSIQRDVFYARARNYENSLAAELFPDKVSVKVYTNLIATVKRHLPTVYRYFDVRRRKMRLRDIHHYDTYVPIVHQIKTRYTWQRAVNTVVKALEPLGSDYCSVLERGLNDSWCDKYENQGKQSGAFSAGSYDGEPYILMNYQPELLDHVFTLAHEAGHSMHSYYSVRHQPYQYYQYTIFVAEVASTFNEQALNRYLMDRARDDRERALLVNRQIDEIRATLVRQTMFAEFELIAHELAEANEPLTLDRFREIYGELQRQYFGPNFVLDDELSLECFRIPHFYHAFYVYKYATGIAASIALWERVASGGPKELGDYLAFLKAGCSKLPLDLLRDAGIDLRSPAPIDAALNHFDRLVEELDELI